MAKKKTAEKVVHLACTVEGHEEDWIKYDTSGWTLATMRDMFEAPIDACIARWVEKDSVDWHLTGDDGIVVDHPGRGAPRAAWMSAYEALGQEGLALRSWLGVSPYAAAIERTTPTTKSEVSSEGVG